MKKTKIIKNFIVVFPTIIALLGALAVVFKIFDLPSKVEANTTRIIELEKDRNANDIEKRYIYESLAEIKADVKMLVKSRMGDKQ